MSGDSLRSLRRLAFSLVSAALAVSSTGSMAQVTQAGAPSAVLTYSDLVGLSEAAAVIARVRVLGQATVEPARSPGLAPGKVRLYLETATEALLKAPTAVGDSLAFLVDVPIDSKGRAPKLKKQSFLVFARTVPGRPGQLQLVDTEAMLVADVSNDARLRAVIADLANKDGPPRITGIRDALSIAGNLAGESETQVFVETDDGSPVSLTVIRRPGMDPNWGVSWTEIVDQAVTPPGKGTLAWYRLACFLPRELPRTAYLQTDAASRNQAQADYGFVLRQLGACDRTRR